MSLSKCTPPPSSDPTKWPCYALLAGKWRVSEASGYCIGNETGPALPGHDELAIDRDGRLAPVPVAQTQGCWRRGPAGRDQSGALAAQAGRRYVDEIVPGRDLSIIKRRTGWG